MTRIAFFEPAWAPHNARDWEIRGSYKYPSLLGNLHERAELTLLMARVPPADDPLRWRLERDHGVRFAAIDTLDDSGEYASEALLSAYVAAVAEHVPDIVSTLNGRLIGFNLAIARAAADAGIDYVYRVAGNDLATRAAVFAAEGRPFSGTALEAGLIAQERFALEAARTVIVMGGTERARVAPLVSDPSKIRICRRGVDRAHFAPAELSPRCESVLFVGRDSAEKGIDLIEAAAAALAAERPNLRFTIAGDFEPREDGNRRYLGFHDYQALPDLYRAHDLLLLPARSEGFPQVVMEAMSCGLPAILSRPLFENDFAEGQGVCLVGLDAAEIARELCALHDDAGRFAAMCGEALGHAEAHFDAAANGPLYHEALLGAGHG